MRGPRAHLKWRANPRRGPGAARTAPGTCARAGGRAGGRRRTSPRRARGRRGRGAATRAQRGEQQRSPRGASRRSRRGRAGGATPRGGYGGGKDAWCPPPHYPTHLEEGSQQRCITLERSAPQPQSRRPGRGGRRARGGRRVRVAARAVVVRVVVAMTVVGVVIRSSALYDGVRRTARSETSAAASSATTRARSSSMDTGLGGSGESEKPAAATRCRVDVAASSAAASVSRVEASRSTRAVISERYVWAMSIRERTRSPAAARRETRTSRDSRACLRRGPEGKGRGGLRYNVDSHRDASIVSCHVYAVPFGVVHCNVWVSQFRSVRVSRLERLRVRVHGVLYRIHNGITCDCWRVEEFKLNGIKVHGHSRPPLEASAGPQP